MPVSGDRRHELLAKALDGGADVPEPDDELRRELAVVSLLVAAGRAAEQRVLPDHSARDRMRQRVLAGLDEPTPAHAAGIAGGAARRRFFAASAVASVPGRLPVAAAAALCLFVALSGISLVLARDALPGDILYGVKRSAESAELGLTFGDEPRGLKHLQFATSRVDEIEALTARSAGSGSSPADGADPYLSTLQDFDTDAAAGSRLLTETVTSGAGTGLVELRTWAEQQRRRLGDSKSDMPLLAAARLDGSTALLDRVIERVSALQARLACTDVTSGASDDLGLLPVSGACVPAAGQPAAPSIAPPSGTQQPSAPPSPTVVPGSPGGGQPGASTGPPGGVQQPGGPAGGTTSPGASTSPTSAVTAPLPLPEITVPPLLPGLPGLGIG
jgi:hypothetical protein